MKIFDADETRMIGLAYGEKYDNMLSRFHLIPERHGQTDGQTDRFAISISRVSVPTISSPSYYFADTVKYDVAFFRCLSTAMRSRLTARYHLRSSVWVCLFVNTITLELFEISSSIIHGSKI